MGGCRTSYARAGLATPAVPPAPWEGARILPRPAEQRLGVPFTRACPKKWGTGGLPKAARCSSLISLI